MKRYLNLDIISAGMLIRGVNTFERNDEYFLQLMEENGIKQDEFKTVFKGHDISKPIPYTSLSNMLAVLMGHRPVPTDPARRALIRSGLERPEICDVLAKSAYALLDVSNNNPGKVRTIVDKDGQRYHVHEEYRNATIGAELFKTEKSAMNSNKKVKMPLLFLDGGVVEPLTGVYSYSMLLRNFHGDEGCSAIVMLFEYLDKLLGCDVRSTLTFEEMCHAVYDRLKDDEKAREDAMEFIERLEPEWRRDDLGFGSNAFSPWMSAIFNFNMKTRRFIRTNSDIVHSSNCASTNNGPSQIAFLRNFRGVDTSKITVNGTIIIEVDDDAIIECIKSGPGTCRCLEGGICICRISNFPKYPDYKTRFTKIFNEENSI